MAKNPYQTLGVSKDASDDAIKKAFRKLAAKYHPDKNPGKENEAKFKEINFANEVLSDKTKRAAYDEFGDASLSQGFDIERARAMRDFQAGGGRGGFGGGGGFRGGGGAPQDMFGGGVDLGDLIGDLFGRTRGRGGGGGRPSRGQDVEASITIDFLAAVKGTTVSLTGPAGGEPLTVRIPPGAEEGSRIRLKGHGMPGSGAESGDLLISVHIRPHPLLRRENDDLYLDLPISVAEAYRGEKVRVPTPDGEVNLKVPRFAQSGQLSRLRGKGVARKGREPGDFYVRFLVHVPAVDDPAIEAAVGVLEKKTPPLRDAIKL